MLEEKAARIDEKVMSEIETVYDVYRAGVLVSQTPERDADGLRHPIMLGQNLVFTATVTKRSDYTGTIGFTASATPPQWDALVGFSFLFFSGGKPLLAN